MKTKTLKVYGLVNFLNKIACYLRTFNPLAAGSIPARPTKNKKGFRQLAGNPFLWDRSPKSTKVYVLGAMFVAGALIMAPGSVHAQPTGWDFYFFGINTKMIKEADYKMVALGAVTSLAVHTAGHYLYAAANDMHVRQDGLREMISLTDNSAREIRQFSQAGFVLQHTVGVALTTIPATRQTDFTKGYVAASFAATALHPAIFTGDNDLKMSDKYGGNGYADYAVFLTVASHNILRVKWYKD